MSVDHSIGDRGQSVEYTFTAVPGPLDKYSLLLARLVWMTQGAISGGRTDLEPIRDEIRRIGWELADNFGFEAMVTANDALHAMNPEAAAAVDKLWSGIGDWLG